MLGTDKTRTMLCPLKLGCFVIFLSAFVFAQTPLPVKNLQPPTQRPVAKVGATNSIPIWNYSVVSPVDGGTYTGVMVGRDPSFHGHRTTTIPTVVVPVRFTFSDGTVLDPGAPDACVGNNSVLGLVTNSPAFNNSPFTINGLNVGSTQFGDAFERANFWSYVAGTPYHIMLSSTISSTVGITVNGLASTFGCGKYGIIDINSWDLLLQQQVIPSLAAQGVGPTSLPVFVLPNVALCDVTGCATGYHSAYNSAALQTYVVAMVDTTGRFGGNDIIALSHEIAEWLDDPAITNNAPSWGHVGQVSGCQADVEVGDPLTGTLAPTVTMNGFTYHVQELAFFSWFFRQSPSLGAGGFYSSNATFKGGAGVVCQ